MLTKVEVVTWAPSCLASSWDGKVQVPSSLASSVNRKDSNKEVVTVDKKQPDAIDD